MRPLLLVLLAGCAAPSLPPFDATSWEARFRRAGTPWRGADAVYSVPLSDDRILWLFGDTFITAPDAKDREGAAFIRNTLAVQSLPGDPRFFWRLKNGKPHDALECPTPGEWLWPLSGQRTGGVLRLFQMRLKAQGQGAFGFAVTGNELFTVVNPDAPPGDWTIRRREIPFSAFTYGAASLLHDGWLYVYGHARTGNRGLLVARVEPERTDDFSSWRFFDGKAWSPDAARARELFPGAATEMSVSRLGSRFVAVSSAPFLSPEIHVRTAPAPEGPWSPASTVYRCPEADWKKGYFCYAAKAHPELTDQPGELVITYACNSQDFWDLFKDLRIYWPRFVRVTLP
jgi:hypothetical protein